jgi:hypothetical protein
MILYAWYVLYVMADKPVHPRGKKKGRFFFAFVVERLEKPSSFTTLRNAVKTKEKKC